MSIIATDIQRPEAVETGEGVFLVAPDGTVLEKLDVLSADIESTPGVAPSITCPNCGATSWNPHDVAERYCGRCNRYQDGEGGVLPLMIRPFLPPVVHPDPGALVMHSGDIVKLRWLEEQVKDIPDDHLVTFMAAMLSLGLYRNRIMEWCARRMRRKLHITDIRAWSMMLSRSPKLTLRLRDGLTRHMIRGRDREETHSIGGYSTRELQTIANLVSICR